MRRGLLVMAVVALVAAVPARAATPESAALEPSKPSASWAGAASPGLESGVGFGGSFCFDGEGQPDPSSGCDFFAVTVKVPKDFYRLNPGALDLRVTDFGTGDLDMWLYERRPDGSAGEFVGGDGDVAGEPEDFVLDKAEGSFWVVVTNYLGTPDQSYKGAANLVVRTKGSISELNARAHPGFRNHRASSDRFTSHSEPTVAQDPLNPNHLMAGSKMYENNEAYLFKVGTYESFDGGRSWRDYGQLPGYCQADGECDPQDAERYRVVSDPTIAWDDEGSAYINVLDALGGTSNFRGFNMTAHVKKPGKPWSEPIVVHDNRSDPLSEQLLLDDKNWIAVDNVTDADGAQNKPGDGKVGTIYICWSFDGTADPTGNVPLPVQQIVLMRSRDGGQTWGGYSPGDNVPQQLSAKGAVSGIGCHIAIGPTGEVYVTWYDNQAQALMQVFSSDRGETFTPPVPIAFITGVDEPFAGQAFRNLSIPASAVDAKGNVYVVVASANGQGSPVTEGTRELGRQLKTGKVNLEELRRKYTGYSRPANNINRQYMAKGDGAGPESGSDVVMFKSTDQGNSYGGPVRVNQDPKNGDSDQFQPWIAVTRKGQVNVSFFDRRNDPDNFFIDTYLARSNDGGQSFFDLRVSESLWDPSVNAPTSVSGKFIGDYQGLAADDGFAYPFWNDTQLNNLPRTSRRYSRWQEVFSARVPNAPVSFVTPPRRGRLRAKRLVIRGRALDAATGRKLRSVQIGVRRKHGRRCAWHVRGRWVPGKCAKRRWSRARGTARWRYAVRRKGLARGRYRIETRAVGRPRRREKVRESGRNVVQFRVRRLRVR
jgi:hypothetical protein